jgi:uncharacterized NAD-dependent epimerase/dehydratase family protein
VSLGLRPAVVAAVALHTGGLDEHDARAEIARVGAETGLTTDDPVRFGADTLLDAVLEVVQD